MAILAGFRLSLSFAFFGQKIGGWTENFWNSNAFPTAGVPTNVATLVAARQQMTSNECYIKSYKIADLVNFRNVLPKDTNYALEAPTSTLAGDAPQIKLGLQLKAAANYKTTQWLGGIPDAQIQNGGRYVPTGVWPTALNGFLTLLKSSGWSICNQNRAALKKPVTNVTNAGIVSAIAHPFNTDDFVRLKNVRGFTEANRIWRIVKLTADTFQLVGWVAYQNPPVFYGPKAVAVLQDPVLNAITEWSDLRGTKHDVGRPTQQLSGRRRRPRITPALLLAGP